MQEKLLNTSTRPTPQPNRDKLGELMKKAPELLKMDRTQQMQTLDKLIPTNPEPSTDRPETHQS